METPSFDPAWLERMYNHRAQVPENPQYLQRWVAASVRVRQALPVVLDTAYGSDASERLDIFPAAPASAAAPVLVFLHGGGWSGGDKSDYAFVAAPFVQAGFCVVLVNYGLCPGTVGHGVTIAQIARQVEAALAWVWRHIGDHGGDCSRITAVGHGAGGHLAALLLTSAWPLIGAGDLPEALVRNALSISGLHDLTPLMHTPFLQAVLQLNDDQIERFSPALLSAPTEGILHAVVGGEESEEYQRQCRLIEVRWHSHAVPRCQVLPGLNHYAMLDALAQPGHDLHHMAQNLLRL